MAYYDVDVRGDEGDWTTWLEETYRLYTYRLTATDRVGNSASIVVVG